MILEVKNLKKTFFQGTVKVQAIKGVSFSIEKGESLSITGPSGSGKSTLLSLLSGLDIPTEGSVIIDGVHVKNLSEKKLATFRSKKIGIVFQQFHLMPHLTALENVSLPLEISRKGSALDEAKNILDGVGLGDRINHLPHELSGGEKQRVAIARALVTKPKILLADEPSGNLDSETGDKVMDLLFKICESNSISLILITHDKDLASKCDLTLNLKDGLLDSGLAAE